MPLRPHALVIGLVLCLAGVSGCGSDDTATTDEAAVVTAAPSTSGIEPAATTASTAVTGSAGGVTAETCAAAEEISGLDVSASETFGEIFAALGSGEITAAEAQKQWLAAIDEAEEQLPEVQDAYRRLAAGAPEEVASAIELVSEETAALWDELRTLDISETSSLSGTLMESLGTERVNALVEAGTTMGSWALEVCGVDLNAG